MKQEDIIRMAREAGVRTYPEQEGGPIESLERFFQSAYNAGAAAAMLKMLMAGNDEWLEEARKAEREACAKVCDSYALAEGVPGAPTWSEACAAAIRARGNT